MTRKIKLLLVVAAVAFVSACATAAGGLIGAGIGSAAGDTSTGALIGAGVGMMIDIMD
jgi:hypothetical protein